MQNRLQDRKRKFFFFSGVHIGWQRDKWNSGRKVLWKTFFLIISHPGSKTYALAKELKSAASKSLSGSETREKGVGNGGGGVGKTGSFDNSGLEPTRVSLWVLSWRKLRATLCLFFTCHFEKVNQFILTMADPATSQVHTHLLVIRNRLLGLLQAKAERMPTLFLLLLQHPNSFPSARASN